MYIRSVTCSLMKILSKGKDKPYLIKFFVLILGALTPPPRILAPVTNIPLCVYMDPIHPSQPSSEKRERMCNEYSISSLVLSGSGNNRKPTIQHR